MNARPAASTITDDQLDALYAELDAVRDAGETLITALAHAESELDDLKVELARVHASRDRYRQAWTSARSRAAVDSALDRRMAAIVTHR